jgi:hypothetical protein
MFLCVLAGNESQFFQKNRELFVGMAALAGHGADMPAELRNVLQIFEKCNWKLTRGIELMWNGERDEDVVLKGADPSSKHVLRAILRSFLCSSSSKPPLSRRIDSNSEDGQGIAQDHSLIRTQSAEERMQAVAARREASQAEVEEREATADLSAVQRQVSQCEAELALALVRSLAGSEVATGEPGPEIVSSFQK